jgi:hypothetical protein
VPEEQIPEVEPKRRETNPLWSREVTVHLRITARAVALPEHAKGLEGRVLQSISDLLLDAYVRRTIGDTGFALRGLDVAIENDPDAPPVPLEAPPALCPSCSRPATFGAWLGPRDEPVWLCAVCGCELPRALPPPPYACEPVGVHPVTGQKIYPVPATFRPEDLAGKVKR